MQYMNVNPKVRLLAKIGLMTALLAVATAFIQFPNGVGGNVNGGDAFIFASVAALGYWSVPAAALGSALVDLFSGYAQYAPATLLIKGLMALFCAYFLKNKQKDKTLKRILVFVVAELIMILGYFAYESLLFNMQTATPGLLFNLIQGLFGVVAGSLLYPIFKRFSGL